MNGKQHVAFLGMGGSSIQWTQHQDVIERDLVEQGIRLMAKSSIYRSQAWGGKTTSEFFNSVWEVKTGMSPTNLLDALQKIERAHGRDRTREVHWGDRPLDIDILFFDDQVVDLKNLQIPHPHLTKRNFVLAPIVELAPALVHPINQLTMQQCWDRCDDLLMVEKL